MAYCLYDANVSYIKLGSDLNKDIQLFRKAEAKNVDYRSKSFLSDNINTCLLVSHKKRDHLYCIIRVMYTVFDGHNHLLNTTMAIIGNDK